MLTRHSFTFFFFNDTATTEIYTLSLHDALPITSNRIVPLPDETRRAVREKAKQLAAALDKRLDRKRKLAGETWTSAQILVALRESDAATASRIDVKLIEQYFRSVAGPECACSRRFPQG